MWKNRIVGYTEEAPDQLLAHYANPRTHDGKQRDAMRASLDELGIIAPCTVNDRSGNMIDGHMRCEEYITAGITRVPVNHLDLSEQEELKAIAFFDRIGALAGTNQENLEYLLENIELDNAPLENLLEDIRDKKTVLPEDIDDIPEVETPVSKLGDLWLLDGHRVLCGDSTDKVTVERLMDSKKADMVFTDPPYGVDYDGGIQFDSTGKVTKGARQKLVGDDTAHIYTSSIPIMATFTDGPIYTFFADTKAHELYEAIEAIEGQIHAMIVWVKNGGYGALNANYKQKHEPCLYWKSKKGKLNFTGASTETTIWELEKDGKNKLHPTQKPVSLAVKAINNHSAKTVLDLFLGSGSTLIACEQTDRTCYGLELEPAYVDVICKRWQTLTGQLPILEATGEAHDFIGK